jgi:CheY-like chemotaxis protein
MTADAREKHLLAAHCVPARENHHNLLRGPVGGRDRIGTGGRDASERMVTIAGMRRPKPSKMFEVRPPPHGKRVLVVEDDAMIRMLLDDMLGELGYIVAAEAAHIDEAIEAVKTGEFDLAILDINVSGESISPVAEALAARGTPFVLATGYAEHGLPELYRDCPTLEKPFAIDGLERILQSLIESK